MTEGLLQLMAHDGVNRLAVRHAPDAGKNQPGLVFLHGFRSDMMGAKGDYLSSLSADLGLGFTRFDLRGHGQSGGVYTDFTLSDWLDDVLQVIDTVAQGPLVIVGSSLGGWLMMLAARARPGRVKGLVGIAPATDFTFELMLPELSASARAAYEATGRITEMTDPAFGPSIFTREMIEDSARHRLLLQPFPFTGPVRLLQGMRDDAVPWRHALRVAENMTGDDVRVTLFKEGGHRLADPPQLAALAQAVAEVVALVR